VLDSQSVKGTDRGGLHGYDGAKRLNGVKRHLLVDTLGIVIKACVSPASVGDRDAAMVLLSLLDRGLTRLRHLWADAGYRGAFVPWAKRALGITVQITHRRDGGMAHTWARADDPPRGVLRFAVVPRRWVVERTFGWLCRWRRLAKDDEYLTATSENAIYLAMSLILTRRTAKATT
jgi:transposase